MCQRAMAPIKSPCNMLNAQILQWKHQILLFRPSDTIVTVDLLRLDFVL